MEEVGAVVLRIALAVLCVALLAAALRYLYFYRREHFVCPRCGYAWKPPLLRMLLSVNAVTGKVIRCPRCGAREYVEPVKDRRPG